MVAAPGQLGSVARHQRAQSDITSSYDLHRLEPLEEWLTVAVVLCPREARSRSRVAMWRRSSGLGGLACQTMEAGPNVQRAGQVLLGSPDVGLMVIGDDGRRLGLGDRPDSPEECLSGGQVPPFTQQYVDHLAVLVDGAPDVALDGAPEEEDLVDVPAPAKPTTMSLGRALQLWTEGLGPGEHGPCRDIDATLAEEFGDLPGGERVAQAPMDRRDDDLRRPTVAREGAAGGVGEVTMAGMASEALTASAIETVAPLGWLVAGRAGGHRPTLPRTLHDFADSLEGLSPVGSRLGRLPYFSRVLSPARRVKYRG